MITARGGQPDEPVAPSLAAPSLAAPSLAALSAVTEDLSPGPGWGAGPDGLPQLHGSRCTRCGALGYPARAACHRCAGTQLAPAALSPAGRLYSWSTVHVSASRPVPYTLGYVDLPEGVRVLAQVAGDPALLTPDCAVRLVLAADELTFTVAR
jgi:uncharacterized protein